LEVFGKDEAVRSGASGLPHDPQLDRYHAIERPWFENCAKLTIAAKFPRQRQHFPVNTLRNKHALMVQTRNSDRAE
jgi:hypothetical protein